MWWDTVPYHMYNGGMFVRAALWPLASHPRQEDVFLTMNHVDDRQGYLNSSYAPKPERYQGSQCSHTGCCDCFREKLYSLTA